MSNQKISVGASISESYKFLMGHMPHFFRLIYGPLILWVSVKLGEQILAREYGIQINGNNILHLFTAAFAIVWYRQFLLGADYASYRLMLKKGFSGSHFTLQRAWRAAVRITVITLVLLVPTLLVSMGMMIYFAQQGVQFSDELIQDLAIKSTFIVMVIFSPILVRLSLYTAGFALGRTSLSFKQLWQQTRGYTATLWLVAIRGFLSLSLYNYCLTWFLNIAMARMAAHYIISTIVVETLAAFLTFMMLAIVVAANAEAFRVLIGVRQGDAPHRTDSGRRREDVATNKVSGQAV
ncbi:MAG: hypothetical protein L3J50_00895 [Emcibacter sp.]|nr:hypothetical protein [Emcibacter sp.]